MSRFRFTNKMFLNDTVNSHVAAEMANAALDEHLKGLVRVYSQGQSIYWSDKAAHADTHQAYLFDLKEIKPDKCLHSSLRTRHDGKFDCADCGKVLEYRLVEV